MKTNSTMISLLRSNQDNPLAKQLLEAAPDSKGFDAAGPAPLRQITDIYRQRARHIKRTDYPIQGFPELVKGLEAFTGDLITIFNVRFDTGDYAVFADPALSELAGVLKFPKKTAAQEAALEESRKQHKDLYATSRLQAA